MDQTQRDRRVDYIEFPVPDVVSAKKFYGAAFGWRFIDYGPRYSTFDDGRITGGFRGGEPSRPGGPLVVIYAADLSDAESAVVAAGGRIVRPVFNFPGGRRFHFLDPAGNELAVWSES
jgi:predicted enzyme related to lactoylglutathione lyase